MKKFPKTKTIIDLVKKPIEELSLLELEKIFAMANREIMEWESFRDVIVWEFKKRAK